ncbi:hypothetical protein KIW84_010417 [Lathyrus oleraceus]|uniref:Uncharacterized protein n=1 Tax=Pisum sativum TaxID=3888 RepID=A0A9D4YJW9_PEA|nr:hypothetical protein KIW84_010417 [Pisum sativum]
MPINSPYGSTYFKHPSGRLSNGRLIIDFIAQAYGLPFLPAYKNLIEGQDITKGVNFAFAGATALDFNYFNKSMVALPGTNNSLSVQLKMFKRLKPSLCKNKKAQAYGLPFLPAYKNLIEGQDITEGVNFAFAGATALDFNYFNKSMVALPGTNNSLSVQLKMFKRLKPSLCKNKKGFDKDETFKACCGGGGPYNFDPRMGCGSPNTTVCSDPSKNINWDGVHFTEVAYKLLAKGLVEGPFAYPSLKPAPFQIA